MTPSPEYWRGGGSAISTSCATRSRRTICGSCGSSCSTSVSAAIRRDWRPNRPPRANRSTRAIPNRASRFKPAGLPARSPVSEVPDRRAPTQRWSFTPSHIFSRLSIPECDGLREEGRISLSGCHPNRGQAISEISAQGVIWFRNYWPVSRSSLRAGNSAGAGFAGDCAHSQPVCSDQGILRLPKLSPTFQRHAARLGAQASVNGRLWRQTRASHLLGRGCDSRA